jgi:hypothetical protein
MIPVWIFMFMYWANDFDNLTTVRIGAVSANAINIFVRAPGSLAQVSVAVAGATVAAGGTAKRQVDLTQFAVVNQQSSVRNSNFRIFKISNLYV